MLSQIEDKSPTRDQEKQSDFSPLPESKQVSTSVVHKQQWRSPKTHSTLQRHLKKRTYDSSKCISLFKEGANTLSLHQHVQTLANCKPEVLIHFLHPTVFSSLRHIWNPPLAELLGGISQPHPTAAHNCAFSQVTEWGCHHLDIQVDYKSAENFMLLASYPQWQSNFFEERCYKLFTVKYKACFSF